MKIKTHDETHIFSLREGKDGVFQQAMFWMRWASEDLPEFDVKVEQGPEEGQVIISFPLPLVAAPKLVESMVSVTNYVEIAYADALKVKNSKGVCVAADYVGSNPPKRCFLRAKEQPLEKNLPWNKVIWHHEVSSDIPALFCDLKFPTV